MKKQRMGTIVISGSKDHLWRWHINTINPTTTIKPEKGIYSSKSSALRAARRIVEYFNIKKIIITYHIGI